MFHPWMLLQIVGCTPCPWDILAYSFSVSTSLDITLAFLFFPLFRLLFSSLSILSQFPEHRLPTFPPVFISHNLPHRSPTTTTTPSSSSYCSSLPWIGRNPFSAATWGARSCSENAPLSVSRRLAEPAGIGVVLAHLRLSPTSPVLSGPVRYGSVYDGAGTTRGAPTAAPVERDGRKLAQDHPRLISRHVTCGAAARLPVLPQRLPDADRLELLR